MRSLRSGLQRLGYLPEDPHRYANTVKPASAMSVLKKPSASKAAKASLLHASLVTRCHASARGLTGVAMAASRKGTSLAGCLQRQSQPHGAPTNGTSTRRATPAPLPTPEGTSRPRAA